MNPAVVVAAVGLGLATFYAAGVVLLGWSPWRPTWASRVPWRWLLLGGLIANWAYLVAVGRV